MFAHVGSKCSCPGAFFASSFHTLAKFLLCSCGNGVNVLDETDILILKGIALSSPRAGRLVFLTRATPPISHCVGRSVGRSVGLLVGPTFTFGMQTAITAPTQLITAPAQLITAPAQLLTAPAQCPRARDKGCPVYGLVSPGLKS